jgi:hypothetical protein
MDRSLRDRSAPGAIEQLGVKRVHPVGTISMRSSR